VSVSVCICVCLIQFPSEEDSLNKSWRKFFGHVLGIESFSEFRLIHHRKKEVIFHTLLLAAFY
jgi:hypothetical protein